MRIVGGKFKGKKLIAPDGRDTRPTSDRARESVFNILSHQDWARGHLVDAFVLDAFAGCGALGLEALSRGASKVTFMEKDEAAQKTIRENIRNLGCASQVQTLRVDVLNPPSEKNAVDLLLMDAPYGQDITSQALEKLMKFGWVSSETLCVIETSKKEKWQPNHTFEMLDERTYGVAKFHFLKWDGSPIDPL